MKKNATAINNAPEEKGQTLTTPDAQTPARVGFDMLDKLKRQKCIGTLPEEHQVQVVHCTEATANDLNNEGGAGSAAVRLLSKDISLRRVAVSHADGVVANMREALRANPNFDPRRLNAAVRSADSEHRKLLAAMDTLARVTGATQPTIHLNGQNVVQIGDRRND